MKTVHKTKIQISSILDGEGGGGGGGSGTYPYPTVHVEVNNTPITIPTPLYNSVVATPTYTQFPQEPPNKLRGF